MPRVGRHPLKDRGLVVEEPKIRPITVTTITHVPMMEGYWANSREVLELFFESLYKNTDLKFDLMVFDNSSCKEITDYLTKLKEEGIIQYLVLCSTNFRKLAALNYLLQAAPGEFIAYADSDVFFLPGWLKSSVKILETFPEAGKVTALPLMSGNATNFPAFVKASQDPSIEIQKGTLIPDHFIAAHQMSLGESEGKFSVRAKDRIDVLIKRNECSAYLAGADFQFVMRRDIISKVLPLRIENPDDYYDPIYSPILEKKLQALGYWQLCTPDYLVHHMGNQIPNLADELIWLQAGSYSKEKKIEKPSRKSWRHSTVVRKFFKRINVFTYKMLFEDDGK